jgi:hypothetical protein
MKLIKEFLVVGKKNLRDSNKILLGHLYDLGTLLNVLLRKKGVCMYTNRESKEVGMSSVLGGVFLGITAGALAVILSDKKNRQQLSKKTEAAKARLQDSVSALKGKSEDLANNVKDDATNKIRDIDDSIKTI